MSHFDTLHSEEAVLNKFHAKMVMTAGVGFFTDAYDLFIIGVVTSILAPIWHLSTLKIALLNGAALAAAAFGAVFFGLVRHAHGNFTARNSVGKTRVIFNDIGERNLTAGDKLFKKKRGQFGS